MTDVKVVLPERNWSALEEGLWALTETVNKADPELVVHGFLGGEFGYGANFENDVFAMRSFYWGDCDCGRDEREDVFWSTHEHAADCYQTELDRLEREAGVHYECSVVMDYDERRQIQDEIYHSLCKKYNKLYAGCAIHCTCGVQEKWIEYIDVNGHTETCALELPNFKHKPSGFEVRWYKYIGRDMETKGTCNWIDAIGECIDSVST